MDENLYLMCWIIFVFHVILDQNLSVSVMLVLFIFGNYIHWLEL
jgi:hypothetical protein